MLLGLRLASKADRLAADTAGDDMLEPDESAPADEQNITRVHLNVLLLRMLAAALGRDVRNGSFEHFQQGLLHAFARDVAGDRNVVSGLADLVDLVDVDNAALGGFQVEIRGMQQLEEDILDVLADIASLGQRRGVADGKGDVENPRQRPGQERLAATRGTDQQDIGLVELDFLIGLFAVNEPFVVVVQGDGEDFLGAVPVRSRRHQADP